MLPLGAAACSRTGRFLLQHDRAAASIAITATDTSKLFIVAPVAGATRTFRHRERADRHLIPSVLVVKVLDASDRRGLGLRLEHVTHPARQTTTFGSSALNFVIIR